jgi:alpha-beta hydrolase superfamily lysophospholipase
MTIASDRKPGLTPGEDYLAGGGGVRLHRRRWLPEGSASAVVLLVHGFYEHSGRHAPMAAALNRRGLAVEAIDLRGHGLSEGERCFVGRFEDYLADLDVLMEDVQRSHPQRPRFLFGHSMGGLVAALWAITRQPDLRGLILSGPLLSVPHEVYPVLRRLAGPVGRVLPRLRVGRIDFRNLSRSPDVVAQFLTDPLVFHGRFPVRTGSEILRAIRTASDQFAAIRLPLLILHGTADRLCDAAGSRALYTRSDSRDKTLRLYDGLYHEVLREPERELVLADLLGWLETRLAPKPAALGDRA